LVTSFSGKLLKLVATRCHILSRKCTKFDFGWGSAPDPAGGAYSAPSDPLAGIEGPTSKGRGEKEWKEAWEGKRERKGEEGEGRERRESAAPQTKILPTPLSRHDIGRGSVTTKIDVNWRLHLMFSCQVATSNEKICY